MCERHLFSKVQDEQKVREAQRTKFIADARAAELKQMGELFSNVQDQAGWDLVLPMVPEYYRGIIGTQFDEKRAKGLAALGIPSEKRALLEQRDEELTARTAEQQARREDRKAYNQSVLGRQQAAAAEREEKEAAKRAEALSDNVDALRKEVSGRKEIAKYRQSSAELASLKQLAKDSSGANDMAIVFAFMKSLDPDSAVRETEYNAAAATGTPDQRMMGLVSKYWTGGPLSPGQRQAFIKAAEAAQSGHKAAYERASQTYRHIAKKRGYDLADLGIEDDAQPRPKRAPGNVDLTKPPATKGGLSPEEEKELAELEAKFGGGR